ncbi:hypothetical protein ACFUGD_01210 [Streptomyces sp. NPDC057217]|uniref:hypothetical protein n=1 Tax=Streptomyces sp. NPDC057217 TaxID=3346054 RepID=UPI003641C8F9
MTDAEITNLWREIAVAIGTDRATAVQRLMSGVAERQERQLRQKLLSELKELPLDDHWALMINAEAAYSVVRGGDDG